MLHPGIPGFGGFAAGVPLAQPSARHSESSITPAAEPAATKGALTSGGTKAAISELHRGTSPRWHIRLTIGFHPPDMATASHLIIVPSVSSTPETLRPPCTALIPRPNRTRVPAGSASEAVRLSIIASTFTPRSLKSRAVRYPESLFVKTTTELPGSNGVAIGVHAHSGSQHDARHVVTTKCNRPFLRARGKDGAFCENAPVPLAGLIWRRFQYVIIYSLDSPKYIPVVPAEDSGARHKCYVRHGR